MGTQQRAASESLPPVRSTPLDQAFDALVAGVPEQALQVLVPVVKGELDSPAGLLAMGMALRALDQHPLALQALKLAAEHGVSGNLPLAVAAASDLESVGGERTTILDRLAARFGNGSEQLGGAKHLPPQITTSELRPLEQVGDALLGEVKGTLEYAQAALDAGDPPAAATPQPFFSSLTRTALRGLLEVLRPQLLGRGARLIEQGALGDDAFVVARGELDISRGGQRLARVGSGTLIGEMALLARAPRVATVVAARPCLVLRAERSALDAIAATQANLAAEFGALCRRRMLDNLLSTSPMLRAVEAAERSALIERFRMRAFEKGDYLIHQGKRPEGLELIASGQVSVSRHEDGERLKIAELGPGDSVGEVAMILRREANADVVADFPTITLHMSCDSLLDLIHERPALLAQLYRLAVDRDEETARLAAEEAADAGDLVIG